MASPISDYDILKASRKANRGVLDEGTISDYLDVMQSGADALPPPVQDDGTDMAQEAFSRQGLASNYQVETMDRGQPDDEGFGEPSEDDIAGEDFQEGDDPQEEQDQTAVREQSRARVKAMGIIERLIYWADPLIQPNIAFDLEDAKLSEIAQLVVDETDIDLKSREDWWQAAQDGRDMAMQKAPPKTFPWPDSANVVFPLITTAANQFAARAYPAIVKDRNVVKGIVIGDDNGTPAPSPSVPEANPMAMAGATQPDAMGIGHNGGPPAQAWAIEPGAKAARAKRIGDHMSYQILEEMPEWEEDTDKLLHILPIEGCAFRKTFRDVPEERNVSVMVMAEHLIVNYWTKSLETAPRITEELRLYPYEVQEKINSGEFLDDDYGPDNVQKDNDPDQPLTFYEQHRRLDLDDDGYTEPYIVTVHRDTRKVARIVARWDANGGIKRVPGSADKIAKIIPVHYYSKFDFLPNKEGGFYGFGLAHELKSLNESINSVLNMLLDAGTMANTGGGFIGKGLSMMAGTVSFAPGEWKTVNSAGADIARSIVPLPKNEPSPVLFQLLGMLIEAGKDISSVKDVLTGDVRAQTMSPTVFMALVEQGLKVFTAIYKRVFRGLKSEFRKLYRLNRIYMAETETYQVGEDGREISRADYQAGASVVPVSDPTMVVDAQKMARTQVLAEFKDDPLMNGKVIRKRILEAAGIESPEEVLAADPAPNPELIAKAAELQIKSLAAKAQVLVAISQAIKNMADADAKVMEPFQTWAQIQLQQVKNEYDRLASESDASSGDQPSGTGGGPGTDSGGMGAMAPPPGDAGAPALPPGLSGAPAL